MIYAIKFQNNSTHDSYTIRLKPNDDVGFDVKEAIEDLAQCVKDRMEEKQEANYDPDDWEETLIKVLDDVLPEFSDKFTWEDETVVNYLVSLP